MDDESSEGRPLRLRAADEEDLAIISAQLQDAIVAICDMAWLRDERAFVMVVNRFRWDRMLRAEKPGLYERCHCGVRFRNVDAVKVRDLDLTDRSQMLELLCVHKDADGVLLNFAGAGTVKLLCATLDCTVEDFGEPWPTTRCPRHVFEEAEGKA